MKNIFSGVVLFMFFFPFIQAQPNNVPSHEENISFIEESIQDLKRLDPAGDVPTDLKEHYTWFQSDMKTCEKQKYFPEFLQQITDSYKDQGKFAQVALATEEEGAIIKFQTIYEQLRKNKPRQADNPTNNCKVKLAPGQYYIWSERKGTPTSDLKRRVYIRLDTSLVTISEEQ